jgi:hypothetical protein
MKNIYHKLIITFDALLESSTKHKELFFQSFLFFTFNPIIFGKDLTVTKYVMC